MAVPKKFSQEPSTDYDIVPHNRLLELQRQVASLKKNPYGASQEGTEMKKTMENLSKSMGDLMGIFKEAAQEMQQEDHDTNVVAKSMKPLMNKVDMLIEQNKKIARGIIAVADMVKEHTDKLDKIARAGPGSPHHSRPKGPMPTIPMPPGKHLNPPMGRMPPGPGMGMPGMNVPSRGASMMPPPPSMPGGPLPPPPGMQPKKKKGWF